MSAVSIVGKSARAVANRVIADPKARAAAGGFIRNRLFNKFFRGGEGKGVLVRGGAIRVEGINRTLKKMEELQKKNKKAFNVGIGKAGYYLLEKSREIVPVDTGRLYNSGFNRLTRDSRNTLTYQVGYSKKYAVYVHERLDLRHAPGKSAKFLEKPARRYRKTLIKIIEDEVKKVK